MTLRGLFPLLRTLFDMDSSQSLTNLPRFFHVLRCNKKPIDRQKVLLRRSPDIGGLKTQSK